MLGLNGKLLDFIYPVGSYYETSDTSFNPNTAWGGTWLEDTKGRVTVALDSEDTDFDTIGDVGGNKTHQHFTPLFMQVQSGAGGDMAVNWNGAQYGIGSGETIKSGAWGKISTQGNAGNKTGYPLKASDESSLQPYVVVKRWHRTA